MFSVERYTLKQNTIKVFIVGIVIVLGSLHFAFASSKTLSSKLLSTPVPGSKPIAYGNSVQGVIGNNATEVYTFDAVPGNQVTISFEAIGFATTLELDDPSGRKIAFDNNPDGTPSKIS